MPLFTGRKGRDDMQSVQLGGVVAYQPAPGR
jgi:hypothetical protein